MRSMSITTAVAGLATMAVGCLAEGEESPPEQESEGGVSQPDDAESEIAYGCLEDCQAQFMRCTLGWDACAMFYADCARICAIDGKRFDAKVTRDGGGWR